MNVYEITEREIDEGELDEFLSVYFERDERSKHYFKRGYYNSRNQCIATKSYQSVITGFCVAWKQAFHPNCTYIAIACEERELFFKLLQQLEYKKNIDYPLQTSVWDPSSSLHNLYMVNNFKEVRKTIEPSLNLSDVFNAEEGTYPGLVKSFEDIKKDSELSRRIVELAKNTYESTHSINPPGIHSFDTWKSLVFEDDVNLKGSLAIIENDEVLAFAILHHSEVDNRIEFGWRGTANQEEIYLIKVITQLQIQYAKSQGYDYIDAEIDDTDCFAVEMYKHFPFSEAAPLVTYQKRSP